MTAASFTYDAGGRETQRNHGNGLSMDTTYRSDNLVSSIDVTGIDGADFAYSYLKLCRKPPRIR